MGQQFHYETVSEAVAQLRQQGFTGDFTITGGQLESNGKRFALDELEILDLYRYEGVSDPADEASVFALSTACGIRGILVTGYGPSAAEDSGDLIRNLHYRFANPNI